MSGRKQLNGIARNAAHQFSSSAEHFAFLSLTTGRNLISIDLMTGKITPDEFRIPRNLNLVEMVMANLHRSFSRFPGTIITSATLMVEFSSEWNGSLFIKSSK